MKIMYVTNMHIQSRQWHICNFNFNCYNDCMNPLSNHALQEKSKLRSDKRDQSENRNECCVAQYYEKLKAM